MNAIPTTKSHPEEWGAAIATNLGRFGRSGSMRHPMRRSSMRPMKARIAPPRRGKSGPGFGITMVSKMAAPTAAR